jgi:hypothetical protein
MSDILQIQGINSKGFGTIPKLVMQDRRLTTEAKAIYAYFCSYAGAGRTAFPSREKIIFDLGMSQSRYYKHFQLLVRHGYIKAEQEKTLKGRFKRNVYTLIADIPCTQNEHTVPCTSFPHTEKPCTENKGTNINNSNINSLNINSQSRQPAKPEGQIGLDMTGLLTEQDIRWQLAAIKEQIGYEDLLEANPADNRLIDEVVSIILDVMVTPGEFLRIDREDRPRALIRHQLSLLDSEAVEFVLGQFKAVAERVTRKRQYLLTALYNARLEFDAHITNMVNHNRNGGE